MGQEPLTIIIPPGQYTGKNLAEFLQNHITGITGAESTYTIKYSEITKKMIFVGLSTSPGIPPVAFSLLFQPGQLYTDQINATTGALESINCPAALLGFDRANITSVLSSDTTEQQLSSTNRVDVNYCINQLYLYINADNSKELTRVELGSGRKDCFHVLFLSNTTDGFYNLNRDTYMPIYYSSPAPIARLSSLTISIRDAFYRLVDLGGHEYSLVLEITTLE